MFTALRGVRMERPWPRILVDRTVKLWDVATGKLLSSLRGHTGGVYTVVWNPNG